MRQGEPLITFDARGRTGNILFQAAACIGYAKQYNVNWGMPRRIASVPRFFELFPGLPICEVNFRNYQEHPDDSFCHQHNVNKGRCWYNHHPIPFHPQGVKIAGFWQSWKYFSNADEEVKKAFRLDRYEEFEGKVSLHIRRGDYVAYKDSFPPLPMEYVKRAVAEFPEGTKFVVFSDGLDWCQENFQSIAASFEYCNEMDERKAMSYMASCTDGNIIANSSFSFWSAYLRHNQGSKIVSPSHKRGCWYGHSSGVLTDCIDLLPPSWHQIEFR